MNDNLKNFLRLCKYVKLFVCFGIIKWVASAFHNTIILTQWIADNQFEKNKIMHSFNGYYYIMVMAGTLLLKDV